jgi:hypothetical protein
MGSYQKVSTQALPLGTVHVPICPLSLYLQGPIEIKILYNNFFLFICPCWYLHAYKVVNAPFGYRCRGRPGHTGTCPVPVPFYHVRANVVPVSSLALLKCDVTRANGVTEMHVTSVKCHQGQPGRGVQVGTVHRLYHEGEPGTNFFLCQAPSSKQTSLFDPKR